MEMKWTVTAGELLQILSFLFAVFAAYNRISLQIRSLETKLEPLWAQYVSDKDNVRQWKNEHQHFSGSD